MKFVRPLYRALFASKNNKQTALKVFLANSDFYHPIARKMVANDLGVILEELGGAQISLEEEIVNEACEESIQLEQSSSPELSSICIGSIVIRVAAVVYMVLHKKNR